MEHVVYCERITKDTDPDPDGFTNLTRTSLLDRLTAWFTLSAGEPVREPFADYESAYGRFRVLCDPNKHSVVYILDEFGHMTDRWDA